MFTILTTLHKSSTRSLTRSPILITQSNAPTQRRSCQITYASPLSTKETAKMHIDPSKTVIYRAPINPFIGGTRDIAIEDSTNTIIQKMSDDNFHVSNLLQELKSAHKSIDTLLRFKHYLYILDKLGIYGEHIETLFLKCCHKNPFLFFALLRSLQLNIDYEKNCSLISRAILSKSEINKTYLTDISTEVKKILKTSFNPPTIDSQKE